MRLINSASLPQSNGAKFQLARPVSYPDGFICERIIVEASVPTRNPSGGALNVVNADVVNLFAAIFGNFSLAFGNTSKETVDNALIYQREREMHVAMVQRDHFYVPMVAGGLGGEIRNQATESAAATTNYTAQLNFTRSFVIERMGHKQQAFCPGASQMRALDLSFIRGAVWLAAAGSVTENGAASISVIFDNAPAKGDRWARVPRLFLSETSGLESFGPDAGGGLLQLWHYVAVAGSTGGGLNNFSLLRDGVPVHDNILAVRVTRNDYERVPLGGYDLNSIATTLLDMPSAVDIENLWVGGKWVFRQSSSDLSPPKLAWLFVPPCDDDYRDSTIGPNIVGTDPGLRTEALLTVETSLYGERVPYAHTSIMPMAILDRADPRFASTPGRLFSQGKAPYTYVPAAIVSAVKATDDADTHAKATLAISASVPGGASPEAGALTSTAAAVAQHIASPVLMASKSFGTGLAARVAQVA